MSLQSDMEKLVEEFNQTAQQIQMATKHLNKLEGKIELYNEIAEAEKEKNKDKDKKK